MLEILGWSCAIALGVLTFVLVSAGLGKLVGKAIVSVGRNAPRG